MRTWLEIPEGTDFSIYNIPFGIAQIDFSIPVVCTRVGDYVLDLSWLAKMGYFDEIVLDPKVFYQPYINAFIALGKKTTTAVRRKIQELLCNSSEKDVVSFGLNDLCDVDILMPVYVGDYTDFYSSEAHAFNVGKMFRGAENALMPNWKHLPVGYHGRASSIIASGAEVHRPVGQVLDQATGKPELKPTERLDFELEVAFVTGKPNALGNTISVQDAEDHIFGFLLINDLSSRDVQRWEYQPLGPFLSKSFASVVSPWVVTVEALEDFRVEGPKQDPEPLQYLQTNGKYHFDINLEVVLQLEDGTEAVITKTNYRNMYWNMVQQLVHQTINGVNIQVGDLYASGTISGSDAKEYGSLLELTWGGENPIELPNGNSRTFIEDGDTIIIRAFAENENKRIGFGESRVKILPAK